MIHHAQLEPLRLDTIHPELNEQMDNMLAQIVERFHDESPRLDPEIRKAQIKLTIDIEYTLEDRRVQVVSKLDAKLPGYKPVVQRFARLPHGGPRILVEQDDSTSQLAFPAKDKGGVQ